MTIGEASGLSGKRPSAVLGLALLAALILGQATPSGTGPSTAGPAARGHAGSAQPRFADVAALTDPSGDPVIAAAGDIACDPSSSSFNGGNGTSSSCRQRYTADLLTAAAPAAVLALGDNQYYCGGLSAFQQSYDLSWGKLKATTRPAVGNHEYLTSGGTGCTSANAGAAGHFQYYGAAAGQPGKGYYSYDVGFWHLIALNSNCGDAGGCGSGSPQYEWLRADLAANRRACTLAYWHIPLFSSGGRASSNTRSLWSLMYTNGVDVALTGHDHIYERFAPMTSTGTRDDARGIREFIVGTGGANHTSLTTTAANSQVRNADTYGVLSLKLHPTSFNWTFVPEAGKTFTDTGTGTCHGSGSDTTAPTVPQSLTAAAIGPGQVDLGWQPSTDGGGLGGYLIYRDGAYVGSSATTSYSDTSVVGDTTHTYTVRAFDTSSNTSAASDPVSVTTAPDTSAPSTPTGLSATTPSSTSVVLSWTASSDDVGVSDYVVTRDSVQLGTTATNSFTDSGLTSGATYSYQVTARDAAGNASAPSDPLAVTTPQQFTLNAAADTFVYQDSPTANFGTAAAVEVDNSPVKWGLFRFSVTGVQGRTVHAAKLRLYCTDASTAGGQVRAVADTTWGESSVTWNTKPAFGSSTVSSLPAVSAGSWYEVDVTSLVSGDGLVSIGLVGGSSNGADYSSREGTAGRAPQLVLTVG
jgi:acid phosphatase type 7